MTYAWSGPSSFASTSAAPTLTGATLLGGTYSVVVTTPGSGCTATSGTVVTVNAAPITAASNSGAACTGTGSVSLNANATSTSGTLTYSWSGPSSFASTSATPTLTGATLLGGTYSVVVTTPGSGCTATSGTIVTVNAAPITAASNSGAACTGTGSVSLNANATSTSGTLTYSWSGPSSFASTSATPILTGATLLGGTYSVVVTTPGSGCTATSGTVVTVNAAPITAASNSGAACTGTGSISLNANATSTSGTLTYAWSGPSSFASTSATPILTGATLLGGTYSVVVTTPGSGCTATSGTIVTVNAAPITAASNSGAACTGIGSVSLNANATSTSGTLSYSWSGPSSFASTSATPILTGATLLGGTYSVVVTTPGSGCTATSGTIVTVNAAPITAASNSGAACTGIGSVSLNANATSTSGTLSYSWSGPSSFASTSATPILTGATLLGGTYSVVVTTPGSGCTATSGTVVTVNAAPITAASNSGAACTGTGSVSLNANATSTSGTLSYAWSGPSSFASTSATPTLTGATLLGGTYSVVVTTPGSGCTATSGTIVTVNAAPITAASNSGAACTGTGSVSLNANATSTSGTLSYSWSGPSSFASTSATPILTGATLLGGTYSVVVTTPGSGCTATSGTVVTVNAAPITAASNSGAACTGTGSVSLNANATSTSGTLSYSWSGPSSFASTSATPTLTGATLLGGTYSVVITTPGSGCTATSGTIVTVNAAPITAASNSGAACTGTGSVSLNANATSTSGTLSYSWSGPSSFASTSATPTLTGATLLGGTYSVVVTTPGSGCTATSGTIVTVNAAPITAASNSGAACTGTGSVSLNANATSTSGTLSYSWSGPGSFSDATATPTLTGATLLGGTYSVVVTTPGSGCTATSGTVVTVNAAPITAASNSGAACTGIGSVSLNANATSTSGTLTYAWSGPSSFASTSATPTLTGATLLGGTYSVVVTTPGSGCTATSGTIVTVNAAPITAASNSGAACTGTGSISLNANATSTSGALTYSWSGPSSFASTIATPTLTGATLLGGTYSVVVTTPGSGCTATSGTVVTVNAAPITVASNSGAACTGIGSVSLNANATSTSGTLSYSWSGPSSFASTSATPTLTGVTLLGGTYSVVVTTPGSGCTATSGTVVTVNAAPITAASNSGAACTGTGSISLNANATSTSGTLTYAWSGPSSFASTSATPTLTGATLLSGTYSVVVTTPGSGCTATSGTIVTVNAAPITAASNSGAACTGTGSVNLNANATSTSGTLSYSWSGPSSFASTSATPTLTGATLLGGTYSVVVTTPGSGCTATSGTVVTVNAAPITAASNSGAACTGTGSVSLNANATSTSGTLTYSWSGPGSFSDATATPTLTGATLLGGTYSVVVTTPGSGCTATSGTVVTVNAAPITAASNSGAACTGTGSVSLNANATSTSGTLSYSWSGPSSFASTSATPTLTGATLLGGTYSVVVTTPGSGCTATSGTIVTVNAAPITAASNSGAACTGTGSVSLNANATSTSGTLSYSWSGPSSFASTSATPTLTGATLLSGTYSVVVTTPGSGCTATSGTVVTVNAAPITAASNSGAACTGTGSVSLNANATSTSGTLSYAWSGPSSFASTSATPTLTGATLLGGTYSVVVTTPGSGCTATSGTIVTVNAAPITAASNSGAACTGTGSVSLNANATSTSGTLSYSWSGPSSFASTSATPTLTGATLLGGTYSVVVTTPGSGCTATSGTIVTVNAAPITAASNSGAACTGTGSVSLNANATSTSGTLTYSWSGPGSFSDATATPTLTGATLLGGTYSVVVTTPGSGCTATSGTIVTVNAAPITAASNSGAACTITGSVSLNANATSTSGTLTYSWSGPSSFASTSATPTLTGATLLGGTYSVVVTTPGSGCTATSGTVVTVNAAPITAASNSGAACTGTGSVSLNANATSTSGTLSYAWSGPSSFASTSATPTLTGATLLGGTYSVVVTTPGSGCTATSGTIVTVNAAPITAASNSGAACTGTGSVSLNANATSTSGTLSYSWSGPSSFASTSATPTLTGATLLGGTYSVVVTTPGSGCTATSGTIVTVNAAPTTNPTNTSPLCAGGTVSFDAVATSTSGPLTYAWSGPVAFTATSATPSRASITTAMAGTYTVTVTTPGSGCNSKATTVVTVNAAPITLASNDGAACIGGTVNLNANATSTSGALSYSWSGPSSFTATSAAPALNGAALIAGTYVVTVSTTGSGCTGTSSTVVTVNVLPVTAASNSGTACTGTGSVSLNANATSTSGTLTYSWSGPSSFASTSATPTLTGATLLGGIYSVVVTTPGSGCTATSGTIVTVNAAPTTNPTNTSPLCAGGTVNFDAGATSTSGPLTYSWSGPVAFTSTSATPLRASMTAAMAGSYTVTVTTPGSGCSAKNTTVVTVNAAPGATVSNDGPICIGGTVNLIATPSGGAAIYNWSGANLSSFTDQNPTATPTITTTYSLTVSSGVASGCSPATIYRTTVTVNAIPTVAPTNTSAVCVNGTVNFNAHATGAATYLWSGPAGFTASVATPSQAAVTAGMAGTYTVTVSNTGAGCTATATTDVTINPIPTATPTNTSPVCTGGTVNFDASASAVGVITYAWSGPVSFTSASGTPSRTAVTTAMAGIYTVSVTAPGSGCTASATTVVTVNPLPSPITGNAGICLNTASQLSDVSTGGTWTSSNTNAVVDGSGNVTGNIAGTATITYELNTGCMITRAVTVNPLPAAIAGNLKVCVLSTTTLSDTPAGGTWASDNTLAALISSTGVVSGVANGTANITYTLPTGCIASAVVTVNPLPGTITGTEAICAGTATTLSDPDAGGTWISGSTGIATIGSLSGSLGGVSSGNATITYTLNTGCKTTAVVTINVAPAAISGPSVVCTGAFISLSDAVTGGSWTSTDGSIATIGGGSGFLVGVSAGTVNVSYALNFGCYTTTVVTVNQAPTVITGATNVCVGAAVTLTDALTPGTWSSSNAALGSVGSVSGVVSGVAAGSVNITYTYTNGCKTTTPITINPLPAVITGTLTVCVGQLTALTDVTIDGVWSTAGASVATVGSGSGFVIGASAGSTTISYTLATGCYRVAAVTVNAVPVAIAGAVDVCAGLTITLSDATTTGTWSSSNTGVSTVGSGSGIVTGVAAGTSVITYRLPTGCTATDTITVHSLPGVVNGLAKICAGSLTALTDTAIGGSWTSSGVAASVDVTGVVTGISAGTSVITYTLASGCTAIRVVTVYALPATISGTAIACVGAASVLSDATALGTWSSSDPGTASVSVSGSVSGITAGTATITYQLTATGCLTTSVFTVNALPAAITGVSDMCLGSGTALSTTSAPGTWSSGTTAVATVDGSGNVSSVTAGTSVITFALGTGCQSVVTVTVHPVPALIAGGTVVCTGSVLSLSDAVAGGTWSSSNTALATVSSAGVVTGAAAGVDTITYSLSTGCMVMTSITINSTPSAITGNIPVCAGSVITLGDAVTGGSWTSSASAIATVDPFGNVSGVAAGSATITYTTGACAAMVVVTVHPLPAAITGALAICVNAAAALSDAVPGGTWTTSDPSVANITGTGELIGAGAGTAIISYTIGTGCITTTIVTVNALPDAITGVAAICNGTGTALSDDILGGVWSSGTTSVATVGSGTGFVTAISAGTANITYTLPTGCSTILPFTVFTSPAAISGAGAVCIDAYVTLSDALAGGAWTTGNASIATVGGGTGAVTGVTAGTVAISYTLGSCSTSKIITVNAIPAVVTGTGSVCIGLTAILTDAVIGGSWTSSASAIATVGSLTGIVSGIAAGTANITYTMPGACNAVTTVTAHALPAAISGSGFVCQGLTTAYGDGTSPGVWSSSNTLIATIGTSGIATGIAPGVDTIIYTNVFGCARTSVLNVQPVPDAITGVVDICIGSSVTLNELSSGGIWNSSAPGVASVGVSSGLVHGLSNGTTTITYKFSTGCLTTAVMTVDPAPSPITGAAAICVGATLSLGEAAGGTWSSGDPGVAGIDGAGLVTGVSNGTSIITYALTTGCYATAVVTVHAYPATISGAGHVCIGGIISLSDAAGTGGWSSALPTIAGVGSTGTVTGVAAGTAVITYTPATGCFVVTTITVDSLPPSITGNSPVCIGFNFTLSDTAAGVGAWSSSNAAIASVDVATGLVTGHVAGTANVTYTDAIGCKATTIVTVNAVPTGIMGNMSICSGALSTLSDFVTGGSWSGSNAAVATVGIGSGVVQGVSPGSATITYSVGTGCYQTTTVTVNETPGAINGAGSVCMGATLTLTDTTAGGVWTSSSTGVAVVGAGTGVMTGNHAGTTTISYSLTTGCRAIALVTVTSTPAAIAGGTTICAGTFTTLSDAVASGTWSSSAPAIAGIDLTTGVVSGLSAGTSFITYSLSAGCYKTTMFTVSVAPAPISAPAAMCIGASDVFTDAVAGGAWSSSHVAVATISVSGGAVTAISAGSTTITYTIGICRTTAPLVVNSLPAAITGVANICNGSYLTLSDGVTGGTWTSSNTGIATVGSGSGVVNGIGNGIATITYTSGTGCYKTTAVTVDPVPAAITGVLRLCSGAITIVTDGTAGGHWTSSNTAIATIGSASAVVSGVSAGIATITYKLVTGCMANALVTVNPLPAAITGPSSVCAGAVLFLSDATSGGAWHSSNAAVASIDPAGNVVTFAAGKDTINYSLATGCNSRLVLTVNPMPVAISGITHVCAGSPVALSDATAGGLWSTNNISVATVGTTTGEVYGTAAGVTTITYKLSGGCNVTTLFTVDPVPAAITGTTHLCLASITTLTDAVTGGTWTSGAPAIVPVGVLSGTINSVSAGTAAITYTLPAGCSTMAVVTVSPLPNAGIISGSPAVCITATTILSDFPTGGTWSSSDTTIATVDPFGVVTGIALGNVIITYTVSQFCGSADTTKAMIVNPLPFAPTITGNTSICIQSETTLSDAVAGGTWSSVETDLATVNSAGVVTGVSAGVATIKYSVTNSCGTDVANILVTVNPFAAVPQITIHPDASLCSGTEFQNFGADVPPAAGVRYTWTVDNAHLYAASPDGRNSLITFPHPGTAVVTLSADVTSTGCKIADSFTVNVSNSISPVSYVIYHASELICQDDSATSFQWGYDDVVTLDSTAIPGAIMQAYYLPDAQLASRNYWVMTTHINGCLQKSYYNLPAAAVGNVSFTAASIRLYPNPADSRVYIEVKGATGTGAITAKVYDMLGNDVQVCQLVAGKGSMAVTGLASGVYTVALVQDGMKIGVVTFVKN